jgi:putative oligomerization/nucleic acid binding protein
MGLLAARAATRMGSRQQYRTMARMQRRRTYVQDRMGARQDFQAAGQEEAYDEAPAAPAQADYTVELERLAQLRDQGVITAEDFDAKKRQLLGL